MLKNIYKNHNQKNIYRYGILFLTLLLTFSFCAEENNEEFIAPIKDTITTAVESKKEPHSSPIETSKHFTFNDNIDTISDELKAFIPEGYSAINLSTGDANLDGISDHILVLRKNTEETTSNNAENKPDKRPLLLLLGAADHSFKLASRNDNAVYCIDCGGAFGDPFTGTTIKNGYFSIEYGVSGGMHWEQVITFKYNKLENKWYLYKDHFINYRISDSDDEKDDGLVKDVDKLETEKDFGKILFDDFNIYNEDGN